MIRGEVLPCSYWMKSWYIVFVHDISVLFIQLCNIISAVIDDIPKLHELYLFEQCSLTVKITDRVATKWKEVALRLHFEGHDIGVIDRDNHGQSCLACCAMFTRWLDGIGRKPTTWRTLIVALKEAYLSTLAEELEKMFLDSSPTISTNQTNSSPAGI